MVNHARKEVQYPLSMQETKMKQPKPANVVPVPAMTVYQNRYAHLRDLIERHGGQSAVAEKLGVSRQQLSHVGAEKPIRNIGDKQARKIEMTFGLPIGHIDQPAGHRDR